MSDRHDERLSAHGWREWRTPGWESHDRTWLKQVPTATPCQLNKDQPGIQAMLKQWDHPKHFPQANHVGYELSIAGDCVDGRGIRLTTSIGDDELPGVLESQVEKLRRLWESANKQPSE